MLLNTNPDPLSGLTKQGYGSYGLRSDGKYVIPVQSVGTRGWHESEIQDELNKVGGQWHESMGPAPWMTPRADYGQYAVAAPNNNGYFTAHQAPGGKLTDIGNGNMGYVQDRAPVEQWVPQRASEGGFLANTIGTFMQGPGTVLGPWASLGGLGLLTGGAFGGAAAGAKASSGLLGTLKEIFANPAFQAAKTALNINSVTGGGLLGGGDLPVQTRPTGLSFKTF